MAPIRVRGDDDEGEDDAINRYLRLLHRERARAERSRQAYVALTRAKLSLHLFVHPRVKQLQGGTEFSADANSMLHNLWPAIGGDAATFEAVGTNDDSRKSRRLPRRPASECRAGWPPSNLPRMSSARGELPPTARRTGRNRIQLGAPDCAARRHRGSRSARTIRKCRAASAGGPAAHARAPGIAAAGARCRARARASRRRTRADRAGRNARGPARAAGCSIHPIRKRIRSSRSRACEARRSSTW